MKTKKRLAALFLAMMMVFSVMAMTASAYGEEGHVHDETCCEDAVIARKPGAPVCYKCNLVMVEIGTGIGPGGQEMMQYKCLGCGATSWGGY